jgi:stage II sporulation protein D
METNQVPTIDVGIMYEREVHFILKGTFHDTRNDSLTGDWRVWYENGGIYLSNNIRSFQIEEGFVLIPESQNECSVILKDVTIGLGFHWERKEDQEFKGGLKFISENQKITSDQ